MRRLNLSTVRQDAWFGCPSGGQPLKQTTSHARLLVDVIIHSERGCSMCGIEHNVRVG